jgi:hypothetical protein
MSGGTFSCVFCKATLPLTAPRCPYCLLAYAPSPVAGAPPHPWLPPVRPGAPVSSLNFAVEPPPSIGKHEMTMPAGSSTSRNAAGCLATIAPTRSLTLSESRVRLKDGCVRAQMIALDENVQLGVIARQERVGEITSQYTLEALPSRKRIRLTRTVSSPKSASATDLLPWTDCLAVANVGQANVLELRAMGPTLEGWVNGAGPFAVHDPVLGTGIFGIRLEHADDQKVHPRRVQVSWMQIAEVTA